MRRKSNVARFDRPAKVAILAGIVLASILALQYLRPQLSAPTHITLGITGADWPIYVGVDAHIFEKYGLNVTIVNLGSGINQMAALVAGQIQIGGELPSVIPAKLQGMDVVQVAAIEKARPFYLVAHPKIKSVEQLKGKIGGVYSVGSGLFYISTVIMLTKLGLDSEKDVTLVGISGGTAAMLAALQAGKIDFTLTSDPVKAEKLGLNVLLFQPDMVEGLPAGTGYATTSRYLRENREIVKKFIMSLTEGTKFFFENKNESKKILGKWLEVKDPETLEQQYKDWAKVALKIPKTNLDQVRAILEALTPFEPKAVNADPKQFIDNSIVEELESEGFFKLIWG